MLYQLSYAPIGNDPALFIARKPAPLRRLTAAGLSSKMEDGGDTQR